MRAYILILSACLLTAACEQAEKGFYEGETAVYFSDFTSPEDTMSYSFLGKTTDEATILLNVRLLGNRFEAPVQLKLKVDAAKTTAVEGLHYRALPASYELGTDGYDFKVPVVLLRHEDLDTKEYALTVGIEETDGLRLAYDTNGRVTILFSNLILEPGIWETVLKNVFGAYSRTKHRICMEIMERPFPDTAGEFNLERNMWRSLGWKCNEYFRENVVMDTDQNPPVRIYPWMQ